MKPSCEQFVDRLVDYVDGALPEEEAGAVARHLAACERCRQTVSALDRSLGLAKVLWEDNLGDRTAADSHARKPQRRVVYCLATAASILLTIGGLTALVLHQDVRQPPVTFAEAKRQVARAGAAAQLLAATHILARCEGTESMVERQYQYILREYADTPAAASIKASRALNLGGTHND
jgi:anti-sigma factor RsiW